MRKHAARVQRAAALPLYYQIFSALRDQILSGDLPYGANVPTEHEIVDRFEVSRITARRAMRELAESGLVERRRRVGTRVIYRMPEPTGGDGRERAIDSLIAFGRETSVQLVEYGTVEATPEEAATLKVGKGDQIVRAVRMRSIREVPLGIIESILPIEALDWVSEDKLRTEPLLQLLRGTGKGITASQQVVSAVAASPEISARLGLEPRAPVMRIERLVLDENQQPVARTIAIYRGDRYRLALDPDAVPHPHVSIA